MEVVGPYLKEFVLGERDWTKITLEAAKDIALRAITLPEDVQKYLTRAVRGELEVKVKGLPEGARLIYAAVRQAVYAAAAMVSAVSGLTLHVHHELELASYCLYAAGAFTLLFLLSAFFAKSRRR
jgi:hypothetical protein